MTKSQPPDRAPPDLSDGEAGGARDSLRHVVLLLVLAGLWGSSFAFVKLAVAEIPPFTLVAVRAGLAALVLVAVVYASGRRMPREPRIWGQFLVQGTIAVALPFFLISWGQQHIDSALAVIINSTPTLFIVILGYLFTRDVRFDRTNMLGVAAGFVGVIVLIGPEVLAGLGVDAVAQLAVLLASVCYAFLPLYGRRLNHLPPVVSAAGSLLIASLVVLPLALIFDRPWTLSPSLGAVGSLVYAALAASALGYIIYFHLLAGYGARGVSAVAYLKTGLGVLWSMAFLGEVLSLRAAIALAVILVGVAAINSEWRSLLRPGRRAHPVAGGEG